MSRIPRILIWVSGASPDSPSRPDNADTLLQAEEAAAAFRELGLEVILETFGPDFSAAETAFKRHAPDAVYSLAESPNGLDGLAYTAAALAEFHGVPCAGASAAALAVTSSKRAVKRYLRAAGLPVLPDLTPQAEEEAGRYLVKADAEHASLGISDESVVRGAAAARQKIAEMERAYGGEWLAEPFIEGREFNLSVLQSEGRARVLPPAEIDFDAFPPEKPRIVGYDAKWDPGSFAARATPRRFDFSSEDAPLLAELRRQAAAVTELFALEGATRVDFRVGEDGKVYIIDVNPAPCLASDAGFAAAAARAGLSMREVYAELLPAFLRPGPEGAARVRRGVRPGDVESARILAERTGVFSAEEVRVAGELAEEALARGEEASGYRFIVIERYFCETDGALRAETVAYACYGRICLTRSGYDLYWIVSDPARARAGYSGLALREVEREIRRAGGGRLYAETSSGPGYAPARAFYLKHGFTVSAEQADFYKPGDAKITFEKRVK